MGEIIVMLFNKNKTLKNTENNSINNNKMKIIMNNCKDLVSSCLKVAVC